MNEMANHQMAIDAVDSIVYEGNLSNFQTNHNFLKFWPKKAFASSSQKKNDS